MIIVRCIVGLPSAAFPCLTLRYIRRFVFGSGIGGCPLGAEPGAPSPYPSAAPLFDLASVTLSIVPVFNTGTAKCAAPPASSQCGCSPCGMYVHSGGFYPLFYSVYARTFMCASLGCLPTVLFLFCLLVGDIIPVLRFSRGYYSLPSF